MGLLFIWIYLGSPSCVTVNKMVCLHLTFHLWSLLDIGVFIPFSIHPSLFCWGVLIKISRRGLFNSRHSRYSWKVQSCPVLRLSHRALLE